MTTYIVKVNTVTVETDKVQIKWVVDNNLIPTWSARMTDISETMVIYENKNSTLCF